MAADPTPRPRVAVGTLGGTVAMTTSTEGGIVPTLGAEDLVGRLGEAVGVRVTAQSIRSVGSSSIELADLRATLHWAREQVDAGASGVVVAQGTDTMEETAWLWDLVWDRPQPFVVTGAMRGADAPGADGPANLCDALIVASAPGARERGVLVTLAGQVHSAAWVRKAHASSLAAFTSPDAGPVASIVEGRVHWFTPAAPRHAALSLPAGSLSDPWVPLTTFHLGDDGTLARMAVESGAAGLVIAGSGAGHVSAAASDVLAELAGRVPIAFTSRALAGRVHTDTYGYKGAERDLITRGLIPCGWLSPLRARHLLWLLLAGGADRARVVAEFARRGALSDEG